MKKTLLFISCLLSLNFGYAQDGINYQGAATDANGDELTNQSISIRASVLSTSANGNLEWEETHSTTTDQFGLFNVVIGQGTNTTNGATATFDDMDWGSGNHFLKIEMDASGGTNYAMIGTTQMMSVPYALYAKSAGIDSTTLANMIGSSGGMGGGCDYSFPEGIGESIVWDLGHGNNDYTVPAGKNLFITHVHVEDGSSFKINGIRVIDEPWGTSNSPAMLIQPLCVKANEVISGSSNATYTETFYGVLTDAIVEPISFWFDDPGTGFDTYTVPAGKKLFITNIWAYGGVSSSLTVDGVVIGGEPFNKPGIGSNKILAIPLIVNSGSVVSIPDNFASFNGYLADENYFAGCGGGGSSSTSSLDSTAIANMIANSGGNMVFGDFISINTAIETQATSDGFLYGRYHIGGPSTSWAKIYCDTFSGNTNIRALFERNEMGSNAYLEEQFLIPIKQGEFFSFEVGGWGAPFVNNVYFVPLESGGGSTANTGTGTMSVSTFGDTLTMNGQSIIVPGISVQNFPSSLMGSVTDVDGNTYPTIILGNQEWMAANLNTTHFANGNNLNDNSGSNGPCSSQPGYKDNLNGNNFRYYNALAVHDSRNVCPTGWHVPSKAEFETLLGMFGYFSNNDWIGSAVALKSTEPFAWEYSVTSNASMLNFKRDGIIYCGLNQISHTTESWTWTSTPTDLNNTNDIIMNDNAGSSSNSYVMIQSNGNAYNLPIRCVKD